MALNKTAHFLCFDVQWLHSRVTSRADPAHQIGHSATMHHSLSLFSSTRLNHFRCKVLTPANNLPSSFSHFDSLQLALARQCHEFVTIIVLKICYRSIHARHSAPRRRSFLAVT